jgi:predicted acylesterase/phospholipase RssA
MEAVAASGALPSIFPLVTISGKRYTGGGVHAPYNIDLAAGHDVVVLLTPMARSDRNLKRLLDAVAGLGQAAVHVITANEQSMLIGRTSCRPKPPQPRSKRVRRRPHTNATLSRTTGSSTEKTPRRMPRPACADKATAHPRDYPARLLLRQRRHPALIPQEAPGSLRRYPVIPAATQCESPAAAASNHLATLCELAGKARPRAGYERPTR